MNSTKISQLPLATELNDEDLFIIVSENVNRKLKAKTLLDKVKTKYVGESINLTSLLNVDVDYKKYEEITSGGITERTSLSLNEDNENGA